MHRSLIARLSLAALLAATLFTLLPSAAHALSCAGRMVTLLSPPAQRPGSKDAAVPRNARVLVQVFDLGKDPLRGAKIWLRARGGKRIAVDRRVVGQEHVRVVQLTPRKLLAPGRTHEVFISRDGGKARSLGTFKTGAGKDVKPPTLGAVEGHLVDGLFSDGWNPGKRHIRYLSLSAPATGKAPGNLLGIWVTRARAIDYSKPPTVITRHRGPITLGPSPSACPGTNFIVPPAKKGKLRIGLKALDLAGNTSEAREVAVDLAAPRAP